MSAERECIRRQEHSLSSVHWYCRALRAYAKAEEEARDEEVWPGVSDTLPDASEEGEHGRDEDRATPAEILVKRVRYPAAYKTAAQLEPEACKNPIRRTGDGLTYIWCGVNETEEPLVPAAARAGTAPDWNAELLGEEEVGTIDNGLIHLLDSISIRFQRTNSQTQQRTPCTAAATEHMMTR